MTQKITDYMKDHIVYFDGAMGTMVQKHGLKAGENPELFSLTHPDVITQIHRSYLEAGANILTANTFGANAHKLAASGHSPAEIITASIAIAKNVAQNNAYVALDIGPIGELLEPMGTLSFDDAYDIFREEIITGEKAGADLILIETMADLYEIKAAILAAKENTDLPVFVTLTVEESGRTYTGCDPEAFVVLAEGLGVDAIGLNCSLGPVQMLPHLKRLLSLTSLPVIFQPNAGLPKVVDGNTTYDITPEQFGICQNEAVSAGACIVGGCCGTNPDYIAQVVSNTESLSPISNSKAKADKLCTPTKAISLTADTVIANNEMPSADLQASFADYDTSELINIALDAVDEGAEVINLNTAVAGTDETKMMKIAVKELQEICRIPFQITTENPETLEAALRYFNGIAIANIPDVPDLKKIAKHYGAVIVTAV